MRKIIIIVAISVILVIFVVVGSHIMALRPEPSTQSSQQTESHEIRYLRDNLLLESAKVLDEIDKRLKRMEQDLIKIREKLTENNL